MDEVLKQLKTSRSRCKNSYVYRTRHIALFQRALKVARMLSFSHEGGRKKIANRLFDLNVLEN